MPHPTAIVSPHTQIPGRGWAGQEALPRLNLWLPRLFCGSVVDGIPLTRDFQQWRVYL
jgi:hypothetical protein